MTLSVLRKGPEEHKAMPGDQRQQPLECLKRVEEILSTAVRDGGFHRNDVETVQNGYKAFLVCSKDNTPETKALITRINNFSCELLISKKKISRCSWDYLFGPSYFQQLDSFLAADKDVFDNRSFLGILGSTAHCAVM